MRFAGSKLEDFLGKGTDFGLATQEASALRSNDTVQSIERQSEAVNRGIGAAGEIARAEYEAKGAGIQAQAEANADIMSTIGGVLSSGISALPKFGGGGAAKYGYDPAGSQGNPFGTGPRLRDGGY